MRHPDCTIWNAAPPNPVRNATVQVLGGAVGGTATYYYRIVANYPIGSVVSEPFIIVGAPNPVGAANPIMISWEAAPGATSYNVLRWTTPSMPPDGASCHIGQTSTTSMIDNISSPPVFSLSGLTHGAPVEGWAHLNNRDYHRPVLELWPSIRVQRIMFGDGTWQSSSGGGSGVSSVFGRVGDVTSQAGDYTADQILLNPPITQGGWPGTTFYNVQDLLEQLDSGWGIPTSISYNGPAGWGWTTVGTALDNINTYLVENPPGSGGAVSSVFGRTGDVVAQAGDYDASQIVVSPSVSLISGITVQNVLMGISNLVWAQNISLILSNAGPAGSGTLSVAAAINNLNSYIVNNPPSATPPAGANTQIQFNNNGSLGADAGFVFTGSLGSNNATLLIGTIASGNYATLSQNGSNGAALTINNGASTTHGALDVSGSSSGSNIGQLCYLTAGNVTLYLGKNDSDNVYDLSTATVPIALNRYGGSVYVGQRFNDAAGGTNISLLAVNGADSSLTGLQVSQASGAADPDPAHPENAFVTLDGAARRLQIGSSDDNETESGIWLQNWDSEQNNAPILLNPNGGCVGINTLYADNAYSLNVNGYIVANNDQGDFNWYYGQLRISSTYQYPLRIQGAESEAASNGVASFESGQQTLILGKSTQLNIYYLQCQEVRNDPNTAPVPHDIALNPFGQDVHIGYNLIMPNLPNANPGAGSGKLWYDPSDSNRVKYSP